MTSKQGKWLLLGLWWLAWPVWAFSLTDIDGKLQRLEDYRGKWVVLNVWATWCAPCLAEMPQLQALSQARPDVVVLGLAGDGQDRQRLLQYGQKLKLTYPLIAGDEKTLAPFSVRGFPTTLLFDPQGKQVWKKEGPTTQQEIEQVIQKNSR